MCTSIVSNVIYHKFSHGAAFYTLNGKNVNVMLEFVIAGFQCYLQLNFQTLFSMLQESSTQSGHILSFLLSLIQVGHLSVTGESMCTKYWLTA